MESFEFESQTHTPSAVFCFFNDYIKKYFPHKEEKVVKKMCPFYSKKILVNYAQITNIYQ